MQPFHTVHHNITAVERFDHHHGDASSASSSTVGLSKEKETHMQNYTTTYMHTYLAIRLRLRQ